MVSNFKKSAGKLAIGHLRPAVWATFFALFSQAGLAQPYTPDNPDSVVDTLPPAIVELAADIRRQQTSAEADAVEPTQILSQAMAAYQLAVSSGDARAYGRTLSILQRWPDGSQPPAMYHILLAAVLQHNHAFDEALSELQPITDARPNAANSAAYMQALMMTAQIGLVTGDYARVAQSCEALRSAGRRSLYVNCQAQLDGVTGNARAALDLVDDTLRNSTQLNALDYQELFTTAAIINHRLGDTAQAESYYHRALRLAPDLGYLKVNFANLLLEQGRHNELIEWLSPQDDATLSPELSILLARGLLARGTAADRQHADNLVTRLARDFELAFMRNEAIPHKEYAQYALHLVGQPEAALQAARENWSVQKEPSDTRLLASTAAASGDHATLSDVKQWIDRVGTEDTRLQEILTAHQESAP
jgi:Tfp pilus assembly protein PilF